MINTKLIKNNNFLEPFMRQNIAVTGRVFVNGHLLVELKGISATFKCLCTYSSTIPTSSFR